MMHYLMSLQAHAPQEHEPHSPDTSFGASCGKLRQLVYGKMDLLMLEFELVLDASHHKWAKWRMMMAEEPGKTVHSWIAVLVSCTLEISSELHRRLVSYVKSYPAKLAWLIFTEPAYNPCDRRRQIAHELLQLPSDRVDSSFTGKFRTIFKEELEICARTGAIDALFFQLLRDFFNLLPIETQEVEGTNSMIKKTYQIAPAIKLPLMSDRILIKKALATKVISGETPAERWQSRMDALEFAVENRSFALEQCLGDRRTMVMDPRTDSMPQSSVDHGSVWALGWATRVGDGQCRHLDFHDRKQID